MICEWEAERILNIWIDSLKILIENFLNAPVYSSLWQNINEIQWYSIVKHTIVVNWDQNKIKSDLFFRTIQYAKNVMRTVGVVETAKWVFPWHAALLQLWRPATDARLLRHALMIILILNITLLLNNISISVLSSLFQISH